MACFRPIDAWQTDDGEIVFAERGSIAKSIRLPCGQCCGCRLERSRQWAVRCVHESQLHEDNSYITLTYNKEHLPAYSALNYTDFQLFMKRLRKEIAPIRVRFFMAGEYGEHNWRPHFHALLFGYSFPDQVYLRTTPAGFRLNRSAILESLWPFGYSSVGEVTFESAAYVARYVMKKVNGDLAESHYERIDPETGEVYRLPAEFARMSLKPGIGAKWIERFKSDVFPHGYVVVNGEKASPPRFYLKRYEVSDPFDYDDLVYLRGLRFNPEEESEARLSVRQRVMAARLSFKQRGDL